MVDGGRKLFAGSPQAEQPIHCFCAAFWVAAFDRALRTSEKNFIQFRDKLRRTNLRASDWCMYMYPDTTLTGLVRLTRGGPLGRPSPRDLISISPAHSKSQGCCRASLLATNCEIGAASQDRSALSWMLLASTRYIHA